MHIAERRPPHAVILVAGMGTRLGQLTQQWPKCLVKVNGVPILVNALERLATAGIAEAVLCVGHEQMAIRRHVGRAFGPIRISYVVNTAYATTGNSYSLSLAVKDMDGDVLVLEGDVFFEQRVLDQLLALREPDSTLVERWNPALDGSVVQIGPDGYVRAWVHKKDRPPGFVLTATYKTVNIHRFSSDFLRQRLRPALAAQVQRGGGEPIETVLASIVRDGGRIYAAETCGRWVEIDDEVDLRAAEMAFHGVPHESR